MIGSPFDLVFRTVNVVCPSGSVILLYQTILQGQILISPGDQKKGKYVNQVKMVQAQSTATLQNKHFTQPLPKQVIQSNYYAFKIMNDVNINKYIYLIENNQRQKRNCVH